MRLRRVISALLALGLVVGIGLAGVLWVGPTLSYEAVEAGRFDAIGDRGSRVDAGPFGSYVAKRYAAGSETTAVVSIANTGDRDVEVVQLGDVGRRGAVALAEVRVGRPPRNAPFEAFELPAGEQRAVELRFRMGGCEALEPGATINVSTLLVRYRTGFAERGENIELHSPIEFRRTEDCGRRRAPTPPGSP